MNVSHAFYEAFGTDDRNPIAGRRTDVNAQMAALELSVDVDWWRPVLSLFWASGDDKPTDGTARGFSAIFENARFAGGPFSFWNRQTIPLTQTGVKLVNANSLIPDLRSSKEEAGQLRQPGPLLAGLQFDVRLTPKLASGRERNTCGSTGPSRSELVLFQPLDPRSGSTTGSGSDGGPF